MHLPKNFNFCLFSCWTLKTGEAAVCRDYFVWSPAGDGNQHHRVDFWSPIQSWAPSLCPVHCRVSFRIEEFFPLPPPKQDVWGWRLHGDPRPVLLRSSTEKQSRLIQLQEALFSLSLWSSISISVSWHRHLLAQLTITTLQLLTRQSSACGIWSQSPACLWANCVDNSCGERGERSKLGKTLGPFSVSVLKTSHPKTASPLFLIL